MEVHTGAMKAGAVKTDLLCADKQRTPRSWRNKGQDADSLSRHNRLLTSEKQSAVLLGLQAAQRCSESRVARVEELRAQVEAGTYKVDSTLIAESILQNQTHFLEEDWD